MDRPTIADSSCAVKPGHLLTELGYTNAAIKGSDTSRAANFPQAALRYGFVENLELRLFPPIYNMTDIRGFAGGGHVDGLGDTAFGAKYQFGTFNGFTIAADAKLTVPSGREDFSGGGVQGNFQTIVSYGLTPKLGVTLQLSGSSLTERADNGRLDRYGSFGANLVFGYQLSDKLNLFSELYGNSVSGPRSRGNLSYLGGVQYLLTKSIEFDIGAGTLLAGPQGQQERYFQVGTGLYF